MAKRSRIQGESLAAVDSKPADGGADVLVDQFTREFAAVLQLVREKQSKQLTGDTLGDVQEVAYYGDVTQKLVPLVDKLMLFPVNQFNVLKKCELLLHFGDKLYHAQEFRAASTFFYDKILEMDGVTEGKPEIKDTTYRSVYERILADTADETRSRSRIEGQMYVRSLYGVAMCNFKVQKREDKFIRQPGRLEKILEAMKLLRIGMEAAIALEQQFHGQFSWLILNGSVLLFSIAKPLQAMGFAREVVVYLKWCLIAMESTVTLSTTKYIMWRVRIGSAVCACYEDMAVKEASKADSHWKSAAACAAYVQQIVNRLRREEELDLPLPVDVQKVLTQAEATSSMLVSRMKAVGQPQTKSLIEADFSSAGDQMKVAIDAMENLLRANQQVNNGQGVPILISSEPSNQNLSDLYSFVMETVIPMLTPMVETEDAATLSSEIETIFPLSFHVVTIRCSYELAKFDDHAILLIRSASVRAKSAATDSTALHCLLALYEAVYDIRRSWQEWEVLSDDDRLEANSRLTLPLSGGVIPSPEFLVRLSTALQECVLHGDGVIPRTNRDLLTTVSLQMWREFLLPLLKELDTTEPANFSKSLVRVTCELLLAVHLAFAAVELDDVLLHGQICLRLATLLSVRGKTRMGCQIVRKCLVRITSRRDELMNFSSHFHSIIDVNDDSNSTTAISFASFSCSISDQSLNSLEASTTERVDARSQVGVLGTGSQLGSHYQDLCCTEVDLQLLLYRLELQVASAVDHLPRTSTATPDTAAASSSAQSTVLATTESKLSAECNQNGYAKALLGIQRLFQPTKSLRDRGLIADESIQLLQQIEIQEKELRRQIISSTEERSSTKLETVVPVAPVIVSRSSSAITLKVVEFHPSLPALKKKRVMCYMVFAKAAGAGTAVSITNSQLPGSATPVYPPHLHATISGLQPNETYVFAVAAFDKKHEMISSIGDTSKPVAALNPLPLPLCYGYLAKACSDVHLVGRATKAANYLYNEVVSHACSTRPQWMANPFYRQALKRGVVAQLPVPILNVCIQALMILCRDEPGDLEQEGKLVATSDLDAHPLASRQIKALEDCRKISIAVEIASATDNLEAIRALCFKGYRLLLPLLHLRGSCDGLTFAGLMAFYQALQAISNDKWDVDTRSISARIGFELFRIAQDVNSDFTKVTMPLLEKRQLEHLHSSNVPSCDEGDSLRETMALFKLASAIQTSEASSDVTISAPAAAVVASPRGPPPKGATASAPAKDKTQSNTPQATPRNDAEHGETEGKSQRLDELIQSIGNDLAKIFAALEQRCTSNRQTIEFATKICGVALQTGTKNLDQVDKSLSSLKVTGSASNHFRTILTSISGYSLLQDVEPTAVEESQHHEGSPFSARTGDQSVVSGELGTPASPIGDEPGPDDDYLYRWCGELFFIQASLLYQKLAVCCAAIEVVDAANGPTTEDCTYDLLNNDESTSDSATPTQTTTENTGNSSANPQDFQVDTESDTNAEPSDHEQHETEVDTLFSQLLEKTAGACKLFRLVNCWQSLQAAAQQLWNAIWVAWMAPSRIGTSPARMVHFSTCVDALLDMVDISIHGQGVIASTAGTFTAVISSATAALNVDHIWLTQFMAYSLRAYCSCEDWPSIVQKGGRYYSLCGGSPEGTRFSEQNFSILIYAQQQILDQQQQLLQTTEKELSAFITTFQEQESKKKKKKSRLVVEEVLSPEEIEFRASKQQMEQRIQQLATVRNQERSKLASLSQTYDDLEKAINKGHQALNTCHGLVKKYRRAKENHEDRVALQRQVIASYSRCVVLARQKRQTRIVCQALHEVGDFHLACKDSKSATKSWLESLDNAFSTLNVGTCWREVLTPTTDHFLDSCATNTNSDKIAGDELWIGMLSCSALAKLVMHSSGTNLHKAIDYALMAAAIFTRFYGCSLPHPTKCFLFGSYRVLGQFWPGRTLLEDPERISSFSIGLMFILVPEVLLQYEHQYAATAMPIIASYEYIAASCLQDVNHVANAKRLRVEALVQCGRFHEAFLVLMELLEGGLMQPNSSVLAPSANSVVFHDGKAILDESNSAAINWLSTFNVEHTHDKLKKHYHEALVKHILVAILHFTVALARHESRYDRDTAIVRSAAKKMAQSMLSLLKPSETSTTPGNATATETEQTSQPKSWEELQLLRVRGDILLQLSFLAYFEGEWVLSTTYSLEALDEYNTSPLDFGEPIQLELDQELKFSLVVSRGTFVAKCRSQMIACHLARGRYHSAIRDAQLAIEESKRNGEEHLRQHLELQRLQAAVFIGERETAETQLAILRQDFLSCHTSNSLAYVRTLQALSWLLRSKALVSCHPHPLEIVCERLAEAQQVLDDILEHDGWMGVSDPLPPQLHDKRLNIYRSAVPEFVQVLADLAQVLLECPVNLEVESFQTRYTKALRSVENGLHALEHTTQRMAATRSRLLLMKGILLSKTLQVSTPEGVTLNRDQFEECVEAFTGCIKMAIEGGYDRPVVRLALTELVDLFGQKLIPGNEDAHVQAAFHYLNLALVVWNHETLVFDTLELQNGTITAVEKLPASVTAAIIAQVEAKEDVPVPSTPASKPPDTTAIVNYFVRLLRTQHILPVSSNAPQDTSALMNAFLLQHHSSYARTACLMELTPVPSSDPEIRAGLVCALWGQDLAPAFASVPGKSTSNTSTQNSHQTLYFTLGTTRVSVIEGSPGVENPDSNARMERFASAPVLSKRCGVDRRRVQHLKESLSRLRTHMDDEESLIISRDNFPNTFQSILQDVQKLFRGENASETNLQDRQNDGSNVVFVDENLYDTFGNLITVACTHETVQCLEQLFFRGTNVTNNELCYFFRDLLD